MMRKYILMDIDGTLVNTKEQFYTSLGETLSHFGIQAEMTPELFGMSVNQALQALQVTNIAEAKALCGALRAGTFLPRDPGGS